jgi:hypothetical protein
LKENLLLAFAGEPAHGGFFMLQPKEGDFKLIQDIITKQEAKVIESGKHFDNITGWGHVIKPPDRWRSLMLKEGANATVWKWHGDFADQGMNSDL